MSQYELLHKMVSEKVKLALNLLERAADKLGDDPPDNTWFRDFYIVTGAHMVLTEEGWQPGAEKANLITEYGADYIDDEVNVPQELQTAGG